MPNTVVDVDLRAETGAVAQQTYSDLVVIGDEPTTGGVTYNTPQVYEDAADVAIDYGDASDVHIASQAVESMGADQWWVVMLETATETDELIANSDSSVLNSGTVSNVPLAGDASNVSVSVDGTAMDVVAVTESPPLGAESGEVMINFDTGELLSGTDTSGAGAGIEVTYDHNDWPAATTEMTPQSFDIAILADVRADKSYVGDLDALVSWASGADCAVVAALAQGSASRFANDADAMAEYHEIGGYIPSGNLMTVAHKSTEDVAAHIAGRLSVKRPWFDPFYDGSANYGLSTGYFQKSLIGSPSQNGTLEGGTAGDGSGPTNVLISKNNAQVLSNSLTTAGSQSNYQYFDVKRTEAFVKGEVTAALESLRLRMEKIPFDPSGRALIEDAITGRLTQYVTPLQSASIQSGRPLSDLSVAVPDYRNLSDDDRANRIWSDILIEGTLSSNVHSFKVELAVQV